MSGPKVVRVVTREELVAEGESQMRVLMSSIQSWERTCIDTGLEIVGELERSRKRLDELTAMLKADKFQEFGVAAKRETSYLDSEEVKKRERAAQLHASAISRQSASKQNAQSLIRLLRAKSETVEQGLIERLEAAANGRLSLEESDALLAQGFRELKLTLTDVKLSPEQIELARRLSSNETLSSLAEWKATQRTPDRRQDEANLLMAEIEMFGAGTGLLEMRSRLEAVVNIEVADEQSLRYDSLIFELKRAKTDAVQQVALMRELTLIRSELIALSSSESSVLIELKDIENKSEIEEIKKALATAKLEVISIKAARASLARRRVLIEGLASLGYAINEGMTTALVSSGRLVFHNPKMPGYGVELSGGSAEKLQVRAIAFSETRNKSEDIPAETQWCGDFGKLQSAILSMGGDVLVEKALAVGAVPLRVVSHGDERKASTQILKVKPKHQVKGIRSGPL